MAKTRYRITKEERCYTQSKTNKTMPAGCGTDSRCRYPAVSLSDRRSRRCGTAAGNHCNGNKEERERETQQQQNNNKKAKEGKPQLAVGKKI